MQKKTRDVRGNPDLSNETTSWRKQIHAFACCSSLIHHFIGLFFDQEVLYLKTEKTPFAGLVLVGFKGPYIFQGIRCELHKNIKKKKNKTLQFLWILNKIAFSFLNMYPGGIESLCRKQGLN